MVKRGTPMKSSIGLRGLGIYRYIEIRFSRAPALYNGGCACRGTNSRGSKCLYSLIHCLFKALLEVLRVIVNLFAIIMYG